MRVEFLAADTGHKTEAWLRQEEEGHAQMRNSICNHLDQSEQQKKWCCGRVSMCRSLSLFGHCRCRRRFLLFPSVSCFRSASSSSLFGSFSSFFVIFRTRPWRTSTCTRQERLTEAPIDRNYASGKVFSLRLESGCIQLAACVPAENTR